MMSKFRCTSLYSRPVHRRRKWLDSLYLRSLQRLLGLVVPSDVGIIFGHVVIDVDATSYMLFCCFFYLQNVTSY